MRGLSRAVIALDHHAPIERKARENGERRFTIEFIGRIAIRHIFCRLRKRRHLHLGIDANALRTSIVVSGTAAASRPWALGHGKICPVQLRGGCP